MYILFFKFRFDLVYFMFACWMSEKMSFMRTRI
jgi:hypothetical protein